jgi:integrase
VPLTVKQCDNAQPAATARKLFDGGGLYLLVRPNGTKLWQLAYRHLGKPKTASFGEYASDERKGVTLATARNKRDEAKKLIRAGTDPVQAKRDERTEQAGRKTFQQVTKDWLDLIGKKERSKKTKDRDDRLTNYMIGAFGNRPIDEVNPRDLTQLLDRFERQGSHETRMRTQAMAIRIMGFARGKQWIENNPFADANFNDSYTAPTTQPRPAITEETPFGELLRNISAYSGRNGNLVGIAVQLLAMTFVRPGTVTAAKWNHFDLDGAMWTIPADELKMKTFRDTVKELKDKPHEVPLSRQAVALLRELKELTGWSTFLFPGRKGSRPISEQGLEVALNALGYQSIHCPHGFRSSASTLLNAERVVTGKDPVTGEDIEAPRFAEQAIEFQLEHVNASVAAIYNRNPRLKERTALMQFWSDKIDELRDGRKGPPKLRVVA